MIEYVEKEKRHPVKFADEIIEELFRYVGVLTLGITAGVVRNIGIATPDLIIKPKPVIRKGMSDELKKFGRGIGKILGRAIQSPFKMFVINGLNLYRRGKPMTVRQWKNFERQVEGYMTPYADALAEQASVKTILMALASAEAENQGRQAKNYGRESYSDIERKMFRGYVPDTMRSVGERYEIDEETENLMMESYGRIGEYIQGAGEKVVESVRRQVEAAHRTNRDPRELASDLYWSREDEPGLKNYSQEIMLRDWRRVAYTELARLYGDAKQIPNERQSRESIKNPDRAVYYVFAGPGICDWCRAHLGTIVRHIPRELVGAESDDSLSSRGIKDSYTDTAVWVGKNNYGYKKSEWRVCGTIHVYCGDHLDRIYPDSQSYDVKAGLIVTKNRFDRLVPDDILKEIDTKRAEVALRNEKQEADRAAGIHERPAEYFADWGGRKRKRA